MADGDFKLELSEELGRRLKAAAEAAGRSVDDYAAGLISQGLESSWDEDYARYDEYRRTGEYLDAETVMRDFKAALKRRFSEKRK